MKVRIATIDAVKEFVKIAERQEVEMDLSSQDSRYTVDAKSIMGIFSLDLSKPMNLKICTSDEWEKRKTEEAFKKFQVEDED